MFRCIIFALKSIVWQTDTSIGDPIKAASVGVGLKKFSTLQIPRDAFEWWTDASISDPIRATRVGVGLQNS